MKGFHQNSTQFLRLQQYANESFYILFSLPIQFVFLRKTKEPLRNGYGHVGMGLWYASGGIPIRAIEQALKGLRKYEFINILKTEECS